METGGSINLCTRGDSNPQTLSGVRTSSVCVCQFHHPCAGLRLVYFEVFGAAGFAAESIDLYASAAAGDDGAAGAAAGAAAGIGAGMGGAFEVTLDMPVRSERSVKKSEVKAKVAARAPVNFFMKLEPLGVLISESPPPPNIDNPAPRPV